MLFAVGDLVWIALIAASQAVLIMVGSIVTVVVQKEEAKKAAEKVEEVKSTLETVTQETKKENQELKVIVKDTYYLVNSHMRAQLKLTADLSRWKADSTNDIVHIEAARLAEQKLAEHDAQQLKMDIGK